MHASHAERTGRLRGGLREAGGPEISLQLASALSGQLRSFVNLLDSPRPNDEKLARPFWILHS